MISDQTKSHDSAASTAALRVLIISQHYWPESFRINEVALALCKAGCHVVTLTGQPNYPEGNVFPGYRASAWGCEQHPDGYPIFRVPLYPRGPSGAMRLIANYLSFIVSGVLLGPWLLRRTPVDVIFVYGTSPILQVLVALPLKWRKHAKLVTWVQDLWPESLQSTGYVQSPRILSGVAAVVRWIYRRNDLLLVQSQAFLAGVRAMAAPIPVEVHPNPGELAFESENGLQGPPACSLPPGFNIVFAGNLGTVQALDTILDAAELLLSDCAVRFVLVGSGARSGWLAEEVQRRQLNNVQLAGRFAPEQMPAILAQASALLVSLIKDPTMAKTVPSKVQAYLAAGKPIIASLDGEGARVVEESGAGIACAAEDASALALAVTRLKAFGPDKLESMASAARSYYRANFNSATLAARLRDRLQDLADSSNSARR